MNIGSINNSPYSFYNSSSRINSARGNEAEAQVKVKEAAQIREADQSKVSDAEGSKSSAIYQREDYAGPQRTEVSTDNLYQKAMLTDPHFKMERLASKLFDKLPQIFSDMRNVSESSEQSAAASSKVVISENAPTDYLERQAANAALQDISLS